MPFSAFKSAFMPILVSGSWSLTVICSSNVVAWEAAQTCPVIKNLEADAP